MLALLSTAVAASSANTTECDVLVLGAGLAGTSAAWRIVGERPRDTRKPHVCLLEASNRIGGRTKDFTIVGRNGSSQTVELGAQWIAQEDIDGDVWDLAMNVLGLGIYNGWPWGLYGFPVGPAQRDRSVEERLNRIPKATDSNAAAEFFGPNVSQTNPQANSECRDRVASVYDSVVLGAPWKSPNASALDSITPLEWLGSIGCSITRKDVVAQGLNQVNVSDPQTPLPPAFYISMTSASSSGQEIFWLSSTLWWLHAIKSNTGPLSMTVDLQRYRIVGGPQQMSIRLAEMLQQAGAHIEINSAVKKVSYDDRSVTFTTASGQLFRGRYAVITGTPVALSTHVEWEPPLPPGTANMLRSARIGGYNKHYAFFEDGPVWRDDAAMWEQIQKRAVQWPMTYTALPPLPPDSQQMPNGTDFFPSSVVDNSPVTLGLDGRASFTTGALFSFGWPQNGSTAAQRAEGWREVLRGIPGLPEPSSVLGQAWSEEPFVMGAYGAWWPPGVLTAAREEFSAVPGGRIFFAGTEWSDIGSGYMNGAIHNGRKHGTMISNLLQQDDEE